MLLKKYIKKFLPQSLIIYLVNFKFFNRRYFGVNLLDKKLEKYLNFDNGFFIELGANDGKTQSNTLHFERYRNWNGILIEPSPNNFLKCLNNRKHKTKIFCNACVSFEYKKKFVELIYTNLMSIPVGLESDISDLNAHVELGVKLLNKREVEFRFGAIAKTLNSILEETNAPNVIDLLSLDVEGAELEVLKGIDFKKYTFKYMCIESRKIDTISSYLKIYNYKLVEKLSVHDFLFSSE